MSSSWSSALKIAVQKKYIGSSSTGNCKGLQECEPRQTWFARCLSPMRQGKFLSIAEDRVRPPRAVAFAQLTTFLLSNLALLRWRLYVLHDTRNYSTKLQWCLIKYLHKRQRVRDYIACVRCAGQIMQCESSRVIQLRMPGRIDWLRLDRDSCSCELKIAVHFAQISRYEMFPPRSLRWSWRKAWVSNPVTASPTPDIGM